MLATADDVDVYRYKPSLYMSPNLPALTASSAPSYDPLSSGQQNADFIISPFVLLPDSFGDIYLGETFTAYVAIVTGIQEIPLYNVNLTVRLQTTSSTFDLYDTRAIEGVQSGVAKLVVPYEFLDMIISHKLNELGTHTLRATVQFQAQRNAEVTTIRKFYRFNVLQPLTITCTYIETNDRIMVQCQLSNSSKAQLNVLEVRP
jgi:trafficking protein particle complex subunit 13